MSRYRSTRREAPEQYEARKEREAQERIDRFNQATVSAEPHHSLRRNQYDWPMPPKDFLER